MRRADLMIAMRRLLRCEKGDEVAPGDMGGG